MTQSKSCERSDVSCQLFARAELWVNGGILTIPYPNKNTFNVSTLKRILTYAKTKGTTGMPKLSWTIWKHVICSKLSLHEDLAWAYFETYMIVSDNRTAELIEFERRLLHANSISERNQLREKFSVDTIRFVLLMYLLQFNDGAAPASARYSYSDDEWPMRATSPIIDGRSRSKRAAELLFLTFFQQNMQHILDLLLTSEPDSVKHSTSKVSIHRKTLEALSFLIEGTFDGGRTCYPVHSILSRPDFLKEVNFDPTTNRYNTTDLQRWLVNNLSMNPNEISTCLSRGKHLYVTSQNRTTKIMTNFNFVDKTNKLLYICGFSHQTIVDEGENYDMGNVRIHRCVNKCDIYVLAPVKSVVLHKCRNCRITLGCVNTSLHIRQSDNVTVTAVCRRICLMDTTSCTLYIHTNYRPLILGGCSDITLAPHNTFYPKLKNHIERCSILTTINRFNEPLVLGETASQEKQFYKLMDPTNFYPSALPIQMEGNYNEMDFIHLPSNYRNALEERKLQCNIFRETLQSTVGTAHRTEMNKYIQCQFKKYLMQNRLSDILAISNDMDTCRSHSSTGMLSKNLGASSTTANGTIAAGRSLR
ncbi:hypothetical protein SNEBB_004930 [Seison nebaliae]|nr:hypothetical protein SNEBB_004930 [Seison nebaliae]